MQLKATETRPAVRHNSIEHVASCRESAGPRSQQEVKLLGLLTPIS